MSVHECDNFPGLFVGVYDGHGGCTASQYLRQLLHRLFLDELLNEELALAPRRQPSSATSSSSTASHHGKPVSNNTGRETTTTTTTLEDEDMHSTCSTPPYDEEDVDDDDEVEVDEDEGHDDMKLKKNKTSGSSSPIGAHHLSPSCSFMSKDSILTVDCDVHSPVIKARQSDHKQNATSNAMQLQPAPRQSTTTPSHARRRRRVRTSPTVVIHHPLNTRALDVERAFRIVYPKMDTVLRLRNCARVGATAVTAFLRRVPSSSSSNSTSWIRTLTVANCGDSRAVLCRDGSAVELTQSHRPSHPDERARIEQAGGFVSCGRINGVLNVSRAFGDHWMKAIVQCTPHVTSVAIDERRDEFVVLACDGLWDFVDDQTVCDVARRALVQQGMAPHAVAKLLVERALCAGSTDNVSVMVLQFQVDDDED